MQSFIRRACIEFNDYFDYMIREQSEVSGIWNPLLKNTQWFPEYWPYSWLSPHSLILLASCWAFFFSRQALKTEENKTLSFFRLCASIPILHMTPLLSQLAHADRISKPWGRLKTSLTPLKDHLTPQKGKSSSGLRVLEKRELRIKQSTCVKY